MKQTRIYLLFICFCLFFGGKNVLAKEVSKTCKYTYVNELTENGNTDTVAANRGGTITLSVYTDGSQDGQGKSNGTFLAENFGGHEEILNWGKSDNDAPDIKGTSCPDYIGVIVQGLGDRKWYGFTSSGLSSYGPKVASHDNSNSMAVLKNDSLEDPTYTCYYPDENNSYYSITVDTNQKTLTAKSTLASLNIFYSVSDQLQESWFSEERGTDKCLPTVACSTDSLTISYSYIFNDSMEAAAAGYKNCELQKCSGDDCDETKEYSCITYTKYLNDIDSLYSQIKSATGDTANLYKQVHDKEETLATLCQSVMANYTYAENCVKACLQMEKDINSRKEKYGIDVITNPTNSCSISVRLATWLMRIISWVRYIVPAIIIILTILDFIKAIAADSEDEMKKASGKFVKRLIVAVIIFLLPLILEFLLGIFDISTNNYCLK